MAAGRRKATERQSRERQEPLFDATPTPGLDLRLDPRDRPGGAPETKARRSAPAARERSGAARGRAASTKESRKGKSGGGGRGGRSGRSLFGRLVYWSLVLALWGVLAVAGVFAWMVAHLPPIQSLEVPKRPPNVQILGTDGKTLATRGEMGGASIPVRELPKHLPQAFLAIEDRRFYSHFGIDPVGIARAAVANVMRRGVSQGGSTLTQQLAKNLFLTQERTFERKVQEVVLALWLEGKFTKDQLLELYLNRVYFGAGAYGVEAAAQRYFGKSARQVTLGEGAMLAGLVKSPSRLAPTRNPEGAAQRAEVVLAAMVDAGFISADMAKNGRSARVVKNAGGGSANYVADWVMDVLDDLIGRVEDDVVVDTAIDPELQSAAEAAITEELAQKGGKLGVEQGALVAMTPDGAVRALVGGRNYAESQFNRAVAARRQPGSAFKPFVYLTALERGLTPDTLREDRPIDIKGWRPENYTREYFGPVTLTRALANSLNTVAVRLTLEVGPKAVVQTSHRLGIASKLEANASIGLGTSEVSPLELTSAFTAFANGGMLIVPHVVTRIRNANGKTLYQRPSPYLGRVIDMRYVGMMNAMMQETLLAGTARKAELPNWPAAGKTGTSQDFRDAWFVGYTGRLVTGVWLGNDDSSPTRKMTGGGLPVDIWSRFMKAAHRNVAPVELPGVSGRQPSMPQFAPQTAPPSGVPMASSQGPGGGPASGPGAGYVPGAGYGPTGSTSARPVPPAPVGPSGRPAASGGLTLDGWLVDKLFGRY